MYIYFELDPQIPNGYPVSVNPDFDNMDSSFQWIMLIKQYKI